MEMSALYYPLAYAKVNFISLKNNLYEYACTLRSQRWHRMMICDWLSFKWIRYYVFYTDVIKYEHTLYAHQFI